MNSHSRSLYVIVHLSVCHLSYVTFVHPTQACIVSMPCVPWPSVTFV